MNNPILSINIVVLNGEKYIRGCLESVLRQTYPHDQLEINIRDNGSTDNTISIIEEYIPRFSDFVDIRFIKSSQNLIMWMGHEDLLKTTRGSYLVVLSADVILEKDFIARAVEKLEADPKLGAIQAKVYQFDASEPFGDEPPRRTIDTCGFLIHRSRRISNIGHGSHDRGQFDQPQEIFGIEGAVPVLRIDALKSIALHGEIADHDMVWYAEDLDIAWRLRLAGWKQMYEPSIIAWHDRGTSKGHTVGSWLTYIRKVGDRRKISIARRRLEWRNSRWTRIKNDYIINILQDLPYIVWREIEVLGYAVIFEPGILKEVLPFLQGIPKMLRKRREILSRATASPEEIHSFFI